VTKVHVQARRFADAGYSVVLVGHAGHDEVVGTAGQAPGAVVLVETLEQARVVEVPDPERVAYVTQTTLSVDETAEILAALRERFPAIVGPRKEDICYATTNRQLAVKELLSEIDVLLVIGSANSSNSTRLVETARTAGVAAHMIEDESEIDETWFDGVESVGLTSGASVPERLLVAVCDWFAARGVVEIAPLAARSEDVFFKLPVEVSRAPAQTAA
jgi:4-hydroxy-3-methylbut-2-en-1-yl diphosphate reductase